MRRWHTRRPVLAAAPMAAALLLAGCGIQETDVIEAGGPASVQAFVEPGYDALLFFRMPHGKLTPVIRSFPPRNPFGDEYRQADGAAPPAVPESAMSALLSGPGEADKAAGLGTSLPRVTADGVRVRLSGDGKVMVNLPLALGGLDATAVRQLICTAAYSKDRDGRATVLLTGQDGVTATGTCGLDLNTDATPVAVETGSRTTPPGRAG
ncbi:hypothetical protein [Streptomyces sp. NRRL S-118]|uniref:hypothetical protein n=1 Tax=Streptomyces sp. NRRL S-118 TaxID=1463881 RepID=UPI0018FE2808|nr:hypothetical protein [Streptomyces sp. NRRL S-118]